MKLPENKKIIYEEISHVDAQIKNIPNSIHSPYDFFKLIFDDELIEKIVDNSNAYKNFCNNSDNYIDSNKNDIIYEDNNNLKSEIKINKTTRAQRMGNITKEKIEKFIACIILMGIINLPEYADYWDNNPLLENSISKIMSFSMFTTINQFLHPEKVEAKENQKILNSIKHIMKNSNIYYYPSTFLTIDERMISYRGRAKNVVFEITKPVKWGFRPYVLADVQTGYSYCFKLLEDLEDNEKGKMFGLIKEFMGIVKNNNNKNVKHILATDGLYSSEDLLYIDDYYFIGAIRKNRIHYNENTDIIDVVKKKNFEYFYKIINGKKVVLTKYNDSKMMYVISNFVNAPEEVKRVRWDKNQEKFIEESYPNTIKLYSKYMRGVDLSNQLISYYEIDRRTYKWWKRIFFHLIDLSIINSFIIYKKYFKDSLLTQKLYRLEIVKFILAKYDKPQITKNNSSTFHIPVRQGKQGTCKECSFRKKI